METGTEIPKAPAMEFHVDLRYEFCAPRFFDFCIGETEEEAAAAERWFKGAVSDSASPLVGKVKSVQELSTSCSLEEYIEVQKLVARVTPEIPKGMQFEIASDDVGQAAKRAAEEAITLNKEMGPTFKNTNLLSNLSCEATKEEPCTPKEQFPQHFAELKSINATHTAHNVPSKLNHSELHKQATLNKILQLAPSVRLPAKRCLAGSQKTGLGEEAHATKKQKLEGGQSCQVWNTKASQAGSNLTVSQQFRLNAERQACKRQKLEGGGSCQLLLSKTPRAAPTLTVPHEFHFHTEKRAHIHKETGQCSSEAQAYIPVAEMVQRFQMNILGEFRTQNQMSLSRKRSLKLTQPKEPMLGTSLRARPPTVKSFAEQEEEMLANLPRFKARPLNKKILQGPTLPPLPRSTPQLPEFQEFNLRTMERALMYQHALPPMEVSSAIESRERLCSTKGEFHFETAARARPPKIKSITELEQELAMLTKFKARPLDKRIFSSRGDVGVFTVSKRQATIPKEFQFATDQRAQHHDGILMEQQYQKQRMLQHIRMERAILTKEANEQSQKLFMSNPLPNTALLTELPDSNENYGPQRSAGLSGMGWQSTPTHSSIGPVYPERNRKPLGEIQQHFVFGQAVQQATVLKKHPENNYHQQEDGPFSSSHLKGSSMYPPQVQQSEAFPFHIRPTKDLHQLSTPQMGRNTERQAQKMSFPMYFMR